MFNHNPIRDSIKSNNKLESNNMFNLNETQFFNLYEFSDDEKTKKIEEIQLNELFYRMQRISEKGFNIHLEKNGLRIIDSRDYSTKYSIEFYRFSRHSFFPIFRLIVAIQNSLIFNNCIYIGWGKYCEGEILTICNNGEMKYYKIGKSWYLLKGIDFDCIVKQDRKEGEKIELFIEKSQNCIEENIKNLDSLVERELKEIEKIEQETPIEQATIEEKPLEQGTIELTGETIGTEQGEEEQGETIETEKTESKKNKKAPKSK